MTTNKQSKHFLKLYEQITRAEILSRLGPICSDVDYAMIKIQKENELREYLYGTPDLVKLGENWGLLKTKQRKKKWRRPTT